MKDKPKFSCQIDTIEVKSSTFLDIDKSNRQLKCITKVRYLYVKDGVKYYGCSEPVARLLHHDHETFEKCYVEIVDQVWSKITGMKEAFLALAEDDYDDIISFIQRQNDGKEITAEITQKYYRTDLNNTDGNVLLQPYYMEWARAFWGGFFRVDFEKNYKTLTGKDNSEVPF